MILEIYGVKIETGLSDETNKSMLRYSEIMSDLPRRKRIHCATDLTDMVSVSDAWFLEGLEREAIAPYHAVAKEVHRCLSELKTQIYPSSSTSSLNSSDAYQLTLGPITYVFPKKYKLALAKALNEGIGSISFDLEKFEELKTAIGKAVTIKHVRGELEKNCDGTLIVSPTRDIKQYQILGMHLRTCEGCLIPSLKIDQQNPTMTDSLELSISVASENKGAIVCVENVSRYLSAETVLPFFREEYLKRVKRRFSN